MTNTVFPQTGSRMSSPSRSTLRRIRRSTNLLSDLPINLGKQDALISQPRITPSYLRRETSTAATPKKATSMRRSARSQSEKTSTVEDVYRRPSACWSAASSTARRISALYYSRTADRQPRSRRTFNMEYFSARLVNES